MKARNTPQEMIEIIQAHLDGKKLQYACERDETWHDVTWHDVIGSPCFSFHATVYRVKPVAKKVPLTQADIPLDRPVWISRESDADTDLVVCVRFDSIRTWYTRYSFHDLFVESYKISFDGGKTWQKCEKEVTE